MIIKKALHWAQSKLSKISQSPALDAEVLLSHVLKKNRAWLFANPNHELPRLQLTTYNSLIRKRANHWPVAYLTSRKEFFGLDFRVSPVTLIPRPETELLVELALDRITKHELGIRNIVDVGTGSGAIIIAIAKNLSLRGYSRGNLNFIATDVSNAALKIAKYNALHHGVLKKIKFLRGNLLSSLQLTTYNLPTLILANLPYLTKKQLTNPTIKHEPKTALYGGWDGLKFYRELFAQLKTLCHSGPRAGIQKNKTWMPDPMPTGRQEVRHDNLIVLLEHDPSQKRALRSLAKKYFPKSKSKFHHDLSGKFRVLEIKI